MVGAGAIGAFIAGALARAGVDVTAVVRGAHLAAIRRHGLRVESDLGDFVARFAALEDLRAAAEPFDVLLLTFKAHQWPALLAQVAAVVTERTILVTLQNGVPFWYVREPPLAAVDPGGRIGACFADESIVGAVVHVSGSVPSPGSVRQSGGTRYVFGAPSGDGTARADAVTALFRSAGLEAEIDVAIRETLWLKVVNNCGLNPISAATGLTIRALLADPAALERVRRLMTEALRVGRALGLRADVDVDARLVYAARLDDVRTSMLQDRDRGRELELDPILGAVIELAERHHVEVPTLRATYAELRCPAKPSRA